MKKEYGVLFDQRYQPLLKKLAQMDADFGKRKAYIEEQWGYTKFVKEVLQAVRSDYYQALERTQEKWQSLSDQKRGIEKIEEKADTFDGLAFMEAVQEAVTRYRDQETEDGFRKLTGFLFDRKQNTSTATEQFQRKNGGINILKPENESYNGEEDKKRAVHNKKTVALLKLARSGKDFLEKLDSEGVLSDEERKTKLLGYLLDNKGSFSKKDVETALALVDHLDLLMTSLDKSYEDEEGDGVSIGEFLADSHDPYASLFSEHGEGLVTVIKAWNQLRAASKLKAMMYYRCFLSRNILQGLKTEETEEGKRKKFEELPAGDGEIYELLLPHETYLWENMLHRTYVNSAYEQNPSDLWEVYEWFLLESFQFSDEEIRRVLGLQKGSVSKNRRKFEEAFLQAVEICKNLEGSLE
ncbi:MAG: hypothetical protein Q4B85_02010 [Lachnospiraceae bacterium]|nr:hypothetical protein [Lachnospiraceae bacterium]